MLSGDVQQFFKILQSVSKMKEIKRQLVILWVGSSSYGRYFLL